MTKTHTMRSRLISLVLVLVMVLGCLPLSALAADTDAVQIVSFTLDESALAHAAPNEPCNIPFELVINVDHTKYDKTISPDDVHKSFMQVSVGDNNNKLTAKDGAATLRVSYWADGDRGGGGVSVDTLNPNNTITITEDISGRGYIKATGLLEYTPSASSETVTVLANVAFVKDYKPPIIDQDVYTFLEASESFEYRQSQTLIEIESEITPTDAATVDLSANSVTTGKQISFQVTPTDTNAIQEVYALYHGQLLDVKQAGGKYYLTAPSFDDYVAGEKIKICVSAASTAKTATAVELALNDNKVVAGSTVTATATAKAGNAEIKDAIGSIVAFTWPDNTVTYGYLDGNGKALGFWTPTDAFAATLTEDTRALSVKANYYGNEAYAASADAEETLTVKSRTIAPAPGAAIVATPTAGAAGIQNGMTVRTEYELSLNNSGFVVVNSQGIKLQTANGDYTVTWYENTGSGVWNKIDNLTVTPQNVNTQYKAVFKPAGGYTLGEFELVIGCDKLLDTATSVWSNVTGNGVMEGNALRLAAYIKHGQDSVNGGEVIFRTTDDVELGRAAVLKGYAKIELSSLPAGDYTVNAYYTGVDGVYEASNSEGNPVTFTVNSATLETTGWNIAVDGNENAKLTLGQENTLSIVVPEDSGYTTDDYRVEWLVSKDGGETWALAGTEDTLKVTPANKLYQYCAIVYPDGDYVAPTGGISVAKVTAADDAVVTTSMTLTATPSPAFDGETIVLRAKVVDDKDVPVTAGTVTFTDENGFSYEAPVGMGGFAECTILGGISADTTFTANYADASEIYDDCDAEVTVEVKSREIRLSVNADKAAITVSDSNYTVGSTVELTAPEVYAKDGTTALTVGKDFYYQWQYSTDYQAGATGTDYTATWINFSAPTVGDDGRTIRVTIGDANTAFRVVAMPYGNYLYPATGVVTEAVCGNSDKMTTSVDVQVRSVENLATIYEGDEIVITAKVESNGKAVDEGYVAFMIQKNGSSNLTIGTAEVASNGVATLNYTAYADRMDKVVVNYLGTNKYNASWNNEADVTIKSVEIQVTGNIATTDTLTVNSEATVTLPTVQNAEGETLTIGEDYYIQWLVDDGDGWTEVATQTSGDSYTFTPTSINSKLAAVVFPKGNYSEPAEGVSAGVISNAKTIETTTTLTVNSTDYEGSTAIVTATVQAGGSKVLDGLVEFYVQYGEEGSGDYTKYIFATSRLNKNGEAAVTFEVPVYSSDRYQFYAYYTGTDVYHNSNSDWTDWFDIKSATIAYSSNAIIIKQDGDEVAVKDVKVGESYDLVAPTVVEQGTNTVLTSGTDFYYVWQYSADGSTWETVQTLLTDEGRVYRGAVFGNKDAEYRVIAYPMGGSGSIYRYPANGIVVATSLDPTLRATETTLTVSNYYARRTTTNDELSVFPEGRTITLTAAVKDKADGDPAYGVVEFYTDTNKFVGAVNLDPAGMATISFAVTTFTGNCTFKAVYKGNTVFKTSEDSEKGTILSNKIVLESDDITVTDATGATVAAADLVVDTPYTLTGAKANIELWKSHTTEAELVNNVHNRGETPYYTYVWQKSEDGGVTWYNLDNASNSNVLKNVKFETSLTQYRLAAYPVASSGWIAPAAGVFSKAVSVNKITTTTGISLYQNNKPLKDKDQRVLEGTTVDVVVNVTGIDGYVGGTQGWVKLDVTRKDADYTTSVDVTSSTAKVDNAGNAYFTVELPAYNYADVSNQINFVATFNGDNVFEDSNTGTNVGTHNIKLRSAAIVWDVADDGTTLVNQVKVYEGTDTTTEAKEIRANQDYTLMMPEVYAADVAVANHSKHVGALLDFGTDYTVQWQRQENGKDTATGWHDIAGQTGKTLYLTANSGAENYSYRAVVTPTGDYKYAHNMMLGTPSSDGMLTTAPTADTQLGATHTYLTVSDTQNFRNAANTADVIAEFEGQTVTLTALVKDDNNNLVTTGSVKFYKDLNGDGALSEDEEIAHVDVGSDGKAVFAAEMSEFDTTKNTYDNFYAVYQTNKVYLTSTSNKAPVFVRSSAITWNKTGGEKKTLIVTENGAAYNGELIAGHTYTLTIPDVHELGRYNFTLDVNEDYVINWYMIAADGTQATAISSGTDGNSVTVKPETNKVVYYAEVVPMEGSNYTKAWENGENGYAYTTHLTTNKTNSALSTATTTTLTIEGSVASTHDAFKHQQYEGKTITLNATVTVDGNDKVMVEKGNVSFYVVTESGKSTLIGGQSVEVVNGKASTTYTLPAYTLDDPLNNVEYFYAVYADYSDELSGELRYSSSNTTTAQDLAALKTTDVPAVNRLKIRSIAITWKLENDYKTMVTDGDKITIYNYDETATDHKGTTTDTMIADTSYVLEIPSVRAYSDLDGTMTVLTVGKNYTVQWQYYVTDTASWMNYAADGDSNSVVITPEYSQYSFRAVITPKAQDADINVFTKAAGYENGTVTTLTQASLYTQPTKPTELKDTITDLSITGTVAEANDAKIYNGTPFADLDGTEHYTQYEGETVTLKAKVKDADGNLVDTGHVYFYRVEETENSQTHVRVNTEYVEVKNGFAEYTVTIRDFDEDLATIANVDKFYAVYEADDTFDTSTSTTTTTTTTGIVTYNTPTDVADMVYIRSTAIATPRLTSTENGSRDGYDNKKTTTWTSDLAELPAAVEISFSLMRTAGNETEGYSVVGTDGRWLTNGTDYTIQWYREDKTVDEGGEETGSLKAIDGATQVTYAKAAAENYQKYCVQVNAYGHMKTGAMSKQAIIGKTADPVLDLNPGYTFTEADATFASGVDTTPGAHYGDEVTLTATVQGDETTNALPTGTVTFYYRVLRADGGYTWTKLTDPIDLKQKDGAENKLVAVATYTFNSSKLPFNVDRIGFSYSGDDYYSAYSAEAMQKSATGAQYAKMAFKLWSVQISNPAHEADEVNPADKNYTEADCYPDGKDYGNVTINIYEFSENADGYKGDLVGATADAEYPDIVANTKYTLEVQDIYTKNGEKLDLAHDNSADYTIEWFKSTDGGLTWGPLPETEYTNIDAKTIAVTPETKDYKYMVKVTTTNSFYNEKMPSLVDFEYSEKNVNTILQTVSVDVEAVAETPVNSVDEWVYQSNPITLFATVKPTNNGEPSGHVEFYYGFAKEGSAKGDYSKVEWTAVKSDTESGTNIAELVKTTSGTDTDGVMVAKLTTSNLPVTTDGTYSQLVIKAVYTGDQTYAAQDNIKSNVSISSPVVTVFSSKILQDVENISNEVLTFDGENWTNAETDASGDLYDGVIITGKTLTSDGTKTVITLNPVYTLDVNDREETIFTDLSSIYTLTAGTDYEVEWQYCENYVAYKNYLENPDTADKSWQVLPTASVSSDFCTVEQVQYYAYRAVITPKDTAKAQKSFQDNDKIYSNILVVGDAEARVLTNIRKASSASVKDDTVYIDAIIMGGTTTPVGSVTVTVTDRFGKEAFKANQDIVNGWTTFVWENVQAGEYTITTELTGNNGYVGDANVQNYIVRFTDEVNGGDLDMTIPDVTVTYDGQVQMLDSSKVTINGFVKYDDWYEMAKKSVVFQYFDEDGNRVAEPVDAGTYTVKAYLPETMYWGYVKAADATLTIEKRPVTITDVTAQAKTYDGTNKVYVQNVELELSELDAAGLPTGDDGLVEGDSVYVNAEATVWNADAGERTLTLTSAVLVGPDHNNYEITNPTYSEAFVVSRNLLVGSVVTSITAAPGYKITDDDFYMIDQAGNRITADEATITYVYHGGNVGAAEKENSTEYEGVYTVMISMPENNYQSGLTTLLYIKEGATTTREGTLDKTATSALAYITNTNHVYDGTPKSVTMNTTKGTAKVEYAGDGEYSETAPTNAGRYMVRVTVERQTYYGVMTIVKGEPRFSFSANSVTYDGDRYNVEDLNLSETTNYGVLNDRVSKYGALYYTYVGGSIVGYDYNAPRDVSYTEDRYVDSETSGGYGAYMVTAHVPETANTIAVTPSASFEIAKANLTVTGDEIYTRRFDTHSKLTATYNGFEADSYGPDSELRDLIALPTFKLGDNDILSNIDMTTVGNLTIYLSDVNARNYLITYENGRATTNALPTQDALEIRNDPSTIYYGDDFQLFLYGSRGELVSGKGTATCEASKVTWMSDNTSVATVDENGNVVIKGVGEFTITATRGDDPDTAIYVTETYEALKRRNDVVIERDDYLYDTLEHSIASANYSFYYMYHGTRFKSEDPLSMAHCTIEGQPQTNSGEYPVTVTAINALKNCGDGAGMLAIHRVNSTVTPNGDSATYGQSNFAGKGYDAYPTAGGEETAKVLANGRVAADVRSNSDVDHYEILVAGGTEGWNYNVTYAPYAYSTSSSHDYDINQATVEFTVGSLEDTVGMTENWRTKTGTLLGDAVDPNALFQNEDIRTFGEQNQVLAYVIGDGLVTGDSFIDLFDIDRADTVFAKLNAEYKFSVEGAANRTYTVGSAITQEHGTLNHVAMDAPIDELDYVITGYANSRNYKVTINNGRLDVEQRKVGVAEDTVVMLPAGTADEDIIDIIGPQIEFTGLADKLDHDYRDLLLSIDGKVVTDPGTTAKEYKLTCSNTNYYMDPAHNKITIVIGEVSGVGNFFNKTITQTYLRLQRVIDKGDGTTTVQPATGIKNLKLTIKSVSASSYDKVLVEAYMTEINPGHPLWQDDWDANTYAYYALIDHASLDGYKVSRSLTSPGYTFNCT